MNPREKTKNRIKLTIRSLAGLGLIVLILISGVAPLPGQTPSPSANPQGSNTNSQAVPANSNDNSQDKNKPDDPDTNKKPSRGSWIIAPIPINSPAFGGGIILGVGYIFKLKMEDKLSPPSVIGAAGAWTRGGSRGGVAAAKLYFGENKYQTTIAIGSGRANYDFFGVGRVPGQDAIAVHIRQRGSVLFGPFLRNPGETISIGPRYQYRNLRSDRDGSQRAGELPIPDLGLKSTTAALGFHVQRDLRDSTFYPRKGSLLDFKADFFAKALGSNRTYQTYSLSYNGYHTIGDKQVLAYRGVVCSASERTPFFDLCLYGARSDIRGYTAGELQDHRMLAAQAEYRRELFWRVGFVAFGGVGGIAPEWSKFQFKELLPGGGVGLRFTLDKTNHINYRIDYGIGRAGHTVSFSVTEAF
jgi:hypothetical protein